MNGIVERFLPAESPNITYGYHTFIQEIQDVNAT